MPYADPERRRQYNTQYKQRWRKAQAINQPGVRIFICPRFPSLIIGLGCFDGGFLITSKKEVIEQVLRHPEYMQHIFPVAVDLDLTPTPMVDEDE